MAPQSQLLKESLEIIGRWTLELHISPAFGMNESKSPRVEGLSVHLFSPFLGRAILSISPQSHAMVRKLCPYLILQAGDKLSLKECRLLEPLKYLEPSYCQNPTLPFLHHQLSESPSHQLEPVPELPLVMDRSTSYYCQVNSPGAMRAKLPHEMRHGMPCPCKDHQARCVSIYPMDWEKVGATFGELMEQEPLRTRSPRARNGDGKQPSRFVYDEYLRILVNYLGLEGSSYPRDLPSNLSFRESVFPRNWKAVSDFCTPRQWCRRAHIRAWRYLPCPTWSWALGSAISVSYTSPSALPARRIG